MKGDPRAQDLIDRLKVNPFIDGPADALVKSVAMGIALVPEFRYIFRDNIDVYERFDYSMRQLPALRVYNLAYRKEHESHYILGDLNIDILLPVEIRRAEQQQFQDVLSSAFVQQFRRPSFLQELLRTIPGLNELGKVFEVNKELGMVWDEGILPMTKMKPNFRIDLKQWDSYLEEQGRTFDDPFNVTLGELKKIVGQIIPSLDDGTYDLTAQVDLEVNPQNQGE